MVFFGLGNKVPVSGDLFEAEQERRGGQQSDEDSGG
jgi:hypothetical protein